METNVKAIELKDLWRRYKTSGDERARERLVVAYSPLVKYVAGRMGSGLPAHVEEADLISYGLTLGYSWRLIFQQSLRNSDLSRRFEACSKRRAWSRRSVLRHARAQ